MSENEKNNEISTKKKKSIFDVFFSKLKKIKHLDKILTILFIAIILLIYFSSFSFNNTNKIKNEGQALTNNEVTSLSSYQKALERKIEETISAIKNAGNVNVMVNFSQGIETVIAYTTESRHNKDGTISEIKTPVLITNNGKTQPIVLQEKMPDPTNIIVVASGAKDTNVKLEILRAIQAMFELNSSNIEIFAGN